jgi:hypothetical protein
MEHEQSVQNLAVESYLLGQMTPEEREAFETHYFECAVCAEDLRSASQFIEHAREIFASERKTEARIVPIRPTGWSWLGWLRPQFALAAIAALAVFTGFETLSTIPKLQRQFNEVSELRVVNATHLRPLTRGKPTVLKAISGEPVEFILDLPETSATEAHFVVESANGRAALQRSATLPEGGEGVRLSIMRLDLPAGIYSLVVRTDPGGQELARYPLQITR